MEVNEQAPEQAPHYGWRSRIAALAYIFVCFELGMFLLLIPWLGLWERSYFSALTPPWSGVWNNLYLRGAVSGLGLINLGIALSELLGYLRRCFTDRGR
jgi:hypothetical protein